MQEYISLFILYQIYDGIKLKLCANKKPADLWSAGSRI